MARVELSHVGKVYGRDAIALDDFSLSVDDGELVTLVGPSGCGKSTALRIIAGLEEATSGEVRIGDRVVTDLSAGDRDVAMVFQSAAVFPHLSVADNIGFGLRLRRRPRAEIRERVGEAAAALRLDGLLDRRPDQLSGGQRQRVAIGRAMLRDPQVFLMDEPLSSLDAQLRVHMRAEIGRLQRRLGTTTLYVTHDQAEAMTLGDRVVVMRDGVLEQVATPRQIYDAPATTFVASFIGSPAMNLITATLGPGRTLDIAGQHVGPSTVPLGDGSPVVVGIRPSDLDDAALGDADGRPLLDVHVEAVEQLGPETHVLFTLGGGDTLFAAAVDYRTRACPNATLRLRVDPSRFHYFDPTTGRRLAP